MPNEGRESDLAIGVDGGGTRTIALVGRSSQEILGRGEAGPSNPNAVGFEAAAAQIRAAILAALAAARSSPAEVFATARPGQLTLGVAGTSRPADRAHLAQLIAASVGVADAAIRLVTDVALLLPAAGVTVGVALVAGTGSSAFGVAPDGRTALVGGWGYLLGDDGSAFDVGRQALRAVLGAVDGLSPATRLTTAVQAHLGVTQPRDLIRVVYQSPSPRNTIADLAPLVIAAAREADPTAQQILARAGDKLGRFAGAVARRLDLPPDAPVIGTGGLFQAGELILAPLRQSLARVPLTNLQLLTVEPAIGALRLATGELHLPLGE